MPTHRLTRRPLVRVKAITADAWSDGGERSSFWPRAARAMKRCGRGEASSARTRAGLPGRSRLADPAPRGRLTWWEKRAPGARRGGIGPSATGELGQAGWRRLPAEPPTRPSRGRSRQVVRGGLAGESDAALPRGAAHHGHAGSSELARLGRWQTTTACLLRRERGRDPADIYARPRSLRTARVFHKWRGGAVRPSALVIHRDFNAHVGDGGGRRSSGFGIAS